MKRREGPFGKEKQGENGPVEGSCGSEDEELRVLLDGSNRTRSYHAIETSRFFIESIFSFRSRALNAAVAMMFTSIKAKSDEAMPHPSTTHFLW